MNLVGNSVSKLAKRKYDLDKQVAVKSGFLLLLPLPGFPRDGFITVKSLGVQ